MMNNEYQDHMNYKETNQPLVPAQKPKRRRWKTGALVCGMALCVGLGFGGGMLVNQNIGDSSQAALQENGTSTPAETSQPSSTDSALQLSTDSHGSNLSVADIAAAAADSVVEITTESLTTGNFMQQYVSSGAGSGVIITEDGYIITNNHVIENATNITVTLKDQTSYSAELVGRDEDLDVALLKIDATGLTVASLGDSSKLVVGETVIAIGNPLGQLGGTVTDGIISALDRAITMDGRTMNLMQTDAAINPGNSGGGLFNDQGQLIGLVVAKSSGSDVEGLGFAIPINDVSSILNDLVDYGYVRNKVSLGVTLLDITSDQMAMMYGVSQTGTYIYSVEEDSSASEAGLQSGDCIISINDSEITSTDDVKALLKEASVGDTLHFEILRNGKNTSVEVIAKEYIPEDIQQRNNDL